MAPATTHSLFHTMADIASIRSPYLDRGVSLVYPAFDFGRLRYYLSDHNKAVPYSSVGLKKRDFEEFEKRAIQVK
jgi:lipid A ethanolaminephosphotransferase